MDLHLMLVPFLVLFVGALCYGEDSLTKEELELQEIANAFDDYNERNQNQPDIDEATYLDSERKPSDEELQEIVKYLDKNEEMDSNKEGQEKSIQIAKELKKGGSPEAEFPRGRPHKNWPRSHAKRKYDNSGADKKNPSEKTLSLQELVNSLNENHEEEQTEQYQRAFRNWINEDRRLPPEGDQEDEVLDRGADKKNPSEKTLSLQELVNSLNENHEEEQTEQYQRAFRNWINEDLGLPPEGDQEDEVLDRGERGERGLRGYPGSRGPPGKAQKGERGPPGQRGLPGSHGLRGPPGIAGLPGRPGPPGETGKDGNPGRNGRQGAKGQKGDSGKQGPIGPPGNTTVQKVQGPRGQKGDTGIRGPPGPQGPAGTRGNPGTPGLPGNAGQRGNMGQKGEKGQTGPTGPAGTCSEECKENSKARIAFTCFHENIHVNKGFKSIPIESCFLRTGFKTQHFTDKITAPQPGYYHFIYTVTPALNKQVEELKVLVNGAAQTLLGYKPVSKKVKATNVPITRHFIVGLQAGHKLSFQTAGSLQIFEVTGHLLYPGLEKKSGPGFKPAPPPQDYFDEYLDYEEY